MKGYYSECVMYAFSALHFAALYGRTAMTEVILNEASGIEYQNSLGK